MPQSIDAAALKGRTFRYFDIVMVAFVVILLLSNVIGAEKRSFVTLPGGAVWPFGAGILFFPISYVIDDVLTEVYGYARARRALWCGFAALLFMAGRKGDLNVRAAFAHMAADALIALGVVVSGFIIVATGWHWLDPAASIVISVLIIAGTWSLLRDSVNLALQAVPEGVDTNDVNTYLASINGVAEVHDLHIWGMSTTETALTAHLVIPDGYPGDDMRLEISSALRERFGIGHATIQIEIGDAEHSCELAPAHVV